MYYIATYEVNLWKGAEDNEVFEHRELISTSNLSYAFREADKRRRELSDNIMKVSIVDVRLDKANNDPDTFIN